MGECFRVFMIGQADVAIDGGADLAAAMARALCRDRER